MYAIRSGTIWPRITAGMFAVSSTAIVAKAAGVDQARAEAALRASDWSIKTAIVACAAKLDAAGARARLERTGGHIPAALGQDAAA